MRAVLKGLLLVTRIERETLVMTSTQGVEMTVSSPENDPFKDFSYLNDQNRRLNAPFGFR